MHIKTLLRARLCAHYTHSPGMASVPMYCKETGSERRCDVTCLRSHDEEEADSQPKPPHTMCPKGRSEGNGICVVGGARAPEGLSSARRKIGSVTPLLSLGWIWALGLGRLLQLGLESPQAPAG